MACPTRRLHRDPQTVRTPRDMRTATLLIGLCITFLISCGGKSSGPSHPPESDWPYYGHDAGGMRFSPLTEINRNNLAKLKVAWVFHTGDISRGEDGRQKSSFESTPIMADGTLYVSTPFSRVIALDPVTGKQEWSYDPHINLSADYADGLINRGVSAWLDPARSGGQPCRRRIFIGTIDARLIALDAATGRPCTDFGRGGQIDLKAGIARTDYLGEYEETSPPAVIDGLVIVGSGISDNNKADMPSGVVRAFDARTGEPRWTWTPIPPNNTSRPPGRGAKNAWFTGAANAWAPIVADPPRDLVFVPTGSASPDYWGGYRKGDDKWADSVVALRGKTGQFVWGFQLVHHNLWDYDTAAPPLLTTLDHNGKETPIVIEGNKTGMIYVLHRDTGEPVFPVAERPVPQSHVPGEQTSPTQPFPVAPPPLVPQTLTAAEAWGPTPQDRAACRARISELGPGRIFTPPSIKGTIAIPGNVGGLNWSGGAFDPTTQIYVTFVDNAPFEVHLIPRQRIHETQQQLRSAKLRAELALQRGALFGMTRVALFSPGGTLCNPPPWGLLVAVNLASGKIAWSEPLGTTQDLTPNRPAQPVGVYGLGGPIVTASGLVFVAGTAGDDYLRAFDIKTGKLFWQGRLPAGGQATPMTYSVNGKQYVVIAAGGHGKLGTKQGDSLVAFALP
jgi:quinoprotein glucose dehydrogenase